MRGDGEFNLIARLAQRLGRARDVRRSGTEIRVGIGDDAAVTVPRGAIVTTIDIAMEGVHFRRNTASPSSIGRKALAAALSDIAAMGAQPGEAYVGLGIPDDMDERACLELYEGLGALAAESGTAVLGGDLTRSPVLLLAVTIVGHAPSADAIVGRDGASADQALAVTGELGGSAAGLLVLERPELAASLDREVAASLRRRQLEPEPRLTAGAALASTGASAMIDISDGLGADAGHLAAASGLRAVIELERVPVQAGVAEVAAAAELDPRDLSTAAGEDYELLVALPEDRLGEATDAVSAAGAPLTVIGAMIRGEGVELREPDGSTRPAAGFDQLRNRPADGEPG
jgi:thiamine-monophosphate kinase